MISLIDYINETKETFYNKNGLIIYGGDHELDRMYDRNITRDIIEKTIIKFADKIIDLINSKKLNIGDELILRNKNTNPYLNLPIKYIKTENNKHFIAIKTGMFKNNFLTSDLIIDTYA